MERRLGRHLLSACLLLPVLSAFFLQTALGGNTTFVSDDFNRFNLKRPLWSFADPKGEATVSLKNQKTDSARVEISLPGGTTHDLWQNDLNAPRLLQDCANENFQVEVKFNSTITGQQFFNDQAQGIIVQADELNFIRFDFTTAPPIDSIRAFWAVFSNGDPVQTPSATKIVAAYGSPGPMWMRVTRTGNTWKMYTSLDDVTYTLIDSIVHAMTVTKIGLFAANASQNPTPFTVKADYFMNLDSLKADDADNSYSDTEPPYIYNVKTVVQPEGSIVSWKTDEATSGRVAYGPTSSYIDSLDSYNGGVPQSYYVVVPTLGANSTYHYYVRAWDSGNRASATGDGSVTTGLFYPDAILKSDDFTVTPLNSSIWTTEDPKGGSTIAISNKQLTIAVPGGVEHDIWTTGYNSPRVMQELASPNNEYEVIAKFNPQTGGGGSTYYSQGIVLEQDANNLMKAHFVQNGSNLRIFWGAFVDGLGSPRSIQDVDVTGLTFPLYLRVQRAGARTRVYYSVNGTSWTLVGVNSAVPMNVKKIGVFAGNAGTSPNGFTANIDFFAASIPAKAFLRTPANNAVDVIRPTVLVWDSAAAAPGMIGPNTTKYTLQVSTDAGFGTMLVNDTTLVTNTKTLTNLAATTKYYWRVRPRNTNGDGPISDTWNFTTSIPAPDAPALVSPADNALDVDTSLVLRWTKPLNAATYRLQVATDTGFTALFYNDSTLTDTAKQVNGLAHLTKYYWRVNAKNAGGTSAYTALRAFTTISALPATPAQIAPPNGAVNQQTNVQIRWRRSANATVYKLQVATDSTFASGIVFNDSTLADTSRAMSGLANSTRHFWRVAAKNSAGSSAYSTVWVFTTIIANPSIPVLVSPADGATEQDIAPKLVWMKTATATSYRLQVATDAGFTALVFNDSTITDTSRTLSGLNFNTTYYWRVNAKNVGGPGPYSAVWNFKTYVSDPAIPKPLAPASGSTGLDIPVLLRWTRPTGATSFHLQVATDTGFTALVVNDPAAADTFRSLTNLNYLTKYYWRVNADAVGGTSPYSPRWEFTTGIPTASQVVLLAPANNIDVPTDSVTLRWRKSTPAVDRYWLEIAIDASFQFKIVTDSTITDTTSLRTALPVQAYYWRVRAHNAGGWGAYSDIWKFTRITVGVDDQRALPTSFGLSQNYPNPFNPSTKIEFALPKESRVRLEIFNLIGEQVATLADEVRAAGYHTVTFDAVGLPSGLYFYRLTAGENFTMIRKMVLMK